MTLFTCASVCVCASALVPPCFCVPVFLCLRDPVNIFANIHIGVCNSCHSPAYGTAFFHESASERKILSGYRWGDFIHTSELVGWNSIAGRSMRQHVHACAQSHVSHFRASGRAQSTWAMVPDRVMVRACSTLFTCLSLCLRTCMCVYVCSSMCTRVYSCKRAQKDPRFVLYMRNCGHVCNVRHWL